MPEENNLNVGECQHISYHLPKWTENGKVLWDDLQLQRQSLNAQAKCIKPPTKVIPVVFIPGIMGTNLKSTIGKSSWNAEWVMGLDTTTLLVKNGFERRDILNPQTTITENRVKSISTSIHSLFSDDGNLFPSRYDRHWGEALYLSYSDFLDTFQYALLDDWQKDIYKMTIDPMKNETIKKEDITGILSNMIGEKLGDKHDSPLTPEELTHFKHFLFPVHVFGYNWLQDNAESAQKLATYIDEVINTYKYQHGYGLAIEKVIIVTHSMGGLVARYAMNPPDDAQFKRCQDKVLGVVHGVIPDLGSPAAYRRMKTGADKEGIAGKILGATAEQLMPVLARAPAPLQLLPYPKYRSPWLTIEGEGSYPKSDPFDEIYLRQDVWWRLYESDIIDKDPATSERNWREYMSLIDIPVRKFIVQLEKGLYHPNTYVFYGKEVKSDGFLTWRKEDKKYINPYTGQPIIPKYTAHDRKIIPRTEGQYSEFVLIQSDTAGDGTVPVESLDVINNSQSIRSVLATDVDHQDAYAVKGTIYTTFSPAIKFTLRSIIKMVQEVDIRAAN